MLWSQGCWRHLLYGEGDRSASHGAGRRRRQCVVQTSSGISQPRGPDACRIAGGPSALSLAESSSSLPSCWRSDRFSLALIVSLVTRPSDVTSQVRVTDAYTTRQRPFSPSGVTQLRLGIQVLARLSALTQRSSCHQAL